MRRSLVVGNWKMQGTSVSAQQLLSAIKDNFDESLNVDVIVCPPTPYLGLTRTCLQNTPIRWGAQDVSAFDDGPYTGDISAQMLQDFGCTAVIVGHSERRMGHHETDAEIFEKYQK